MSVTCRKGANALTMMGLFTLLISGCTSSSSLSSNDKDAGSKSSNISDRFASGSKDARSPLNQNGLRAKTDDHSGWWCDEHALPEEVCDLCSRKFREAEKKKGNWCEHGRVKTSCFKCNPSLREKYAREYMKRFGVEPPKPDDDEDTSKSEEPKKRNDEQAK